LVDEAQHMLEAVTADAHVHYSIIEAIAAGEHTWSGITKRVGRSGGSLLRPLQWLEEMQVIGRVVPATENTPQRSKRVLYRVIDPYVAFWHRTVARLVNAGTLGLVAPELLWREVVEPDLDDYMGSVFEDICRDFVCRTDRLPFQPLRVGEWWDATSQNQVDVVAAGGRGDLLVGECKWGRVTATHLATLRGRAQLVAAELGKVQKIHAVLFSARGEFDDEVKREADAGTVLIFSAEDLR
jgi:AAA+ ATPase superfamily predicted ATPase